MFCQPETTIFFVNFMINFWLYLNGGWHWLWDFTLVKHSLWLLNVSIFKLWKCNRSIVCKLVESCLINYIGSLVNQNISIFSLYSTLTSYDLLHGSIMWVLLDTILKFGIFTTKTLSRDIIRIKFGNFFIVELKPITLRIWTFPFFNKAVVVSIFTRALMHNYSW